MPRSHPRPTLIIPTGTIITLHSRPWLVPSPTDMQEPPRAIILAEWRLRRYPRLPRWWRVLSRIARFV